MSLKSRLERLDAAGVGVRKSPSPIAETLDELRRQMNALLARGDASLDRPRQDQSHRARSAFAKLPFIRQDTPSGALWQRTERLSTSHRVGRVAVELAASAKPDVLAELALDVAVAESVPHSWLFLDTETTGLGGAGTLAFLVGMAGLDASGTVVVEQLIVRDPSEEAAMLARVAERVHAASLIVSFNGKAFDRPLLESRNVMNRLPPLPERPHLDCCTLGGVCIASGSAIVR